MVHLLFCCFRSQGSPFRSPKLKQWHWRPNFACVERTSSGCLFKQIPVFSSLPSEPHCRVWFTLAVRISHVLWRRLCWSCEIMQAVANKLRCCHKIALGLPRISHMISLCSSWCSKEFTRYLNSRRIHQKLNVFTLEIFVQLQTRC